ncbi:MAG: sensor histidine kinase [Nitrospirae bacterium]|nr:MAG: sensor histidine kinase [Nitrospirota bacterium]
MQVITSLLNLQSKDISDKKTLQIFEDTKNRIHSMALVHEKLYKTKNLSEVNLSDYIKDLAGAMIKSHGDTKKRISLHMDVAKIPVSIDTITPLGLVINEIITNALKYAFPDNREGLITIKGRSAEDESIELSFSDNGTGMPKNIDLRKTDSLGLTIIRTLIVSQIKGKLEMLTQNGTTFVIRFKDKGYPARI